MDGTLALQPPAGIIARRESRQTVKQIFEFYRNKYRKLLERKTQIEKANKDGEFQRTAAGIAAKFALTFTPTLVRGLGRLAINIGTPIINWINKIKDNQSVKEVEREMKALKEEYANETGQEMDVESEKGKSL